MFHPEGKRRRGVEERLTTSQKKLREWIIDRTELEGREIEDIDMK